MARRPDTEPDESSQNITEIPLPSETQSEAQKLKAGGRKLNGEERFRVRNGASQARHSNPVGEDDEERDEEEEEGSQEEDDEGDADPEGAEETSPKGSKRVRLNGHGDGTSAKLSRKRQGETPQTLPPRDIDG